MSLEPKAAIQAQDRSGQREITTTRIIARSDHSLTRIREHPFRKVSETLGRVAIAMEHTGFWQVSEPEMPPVCQPGATARRMRRFPRLPPAANVLADELLSRLRAASSLAARPRIDLEEHMDHSRHIRLSSAELTEAVIANAPVYGADDRKIGSISHCHGTGTVTEVVIDVGGFLGIGSKPVLVGIDQLDLMRDEKGGVHGVTSWTREQLKSLPKHHH